MKDLQGNSSYMFYEYGSTKFYMYKPPSTLKRVFNLNPYLYRNICLLKSHEYYEKNLQCVLIKCVDKNSTH